MGYLIIQIIVCLLIAALIGFILGWLLRGLGCKDLNSNEGTGSDFKHKPNNPSSSGSTSAKGGLSSQADDFYPEPVTKAPAKPRQKNKPTIDEKTKQDLSNVKPTKDTSSLSVSKNSSSSNTSQSVKKSSKNESEISKEKKVDFSNNTSTINTLSSSGSSSSASIGSAKAKADDFYPEPVTKAPAISHKIEKIEGIGKSLGNRTRKIGIKTTKDLLKKCATKTGLQQVIDATKVTEDTAKQWVGMAGLMCVANIDGQVAELMLASGINSTEELATADPQALTKEMLVVNNREKKIPSSIELPNAGKIEEMIKVAKTL